MDKISNSKMIEKLANFRKRGDKLVDDIFEINNRIFSIIDELQNKKEKSDCEVEVLEKLTSMLELLLTSVMDADRYNTSVFNDYTKVIKNLGGSAKND